MKTVAEYEAEIAKLQAGLQAKKDKLALFQDAEPHIKLATFLHDNLCRWNHTDGCGWGYEKWEDPGYAKTKYIKRAKALAALHPHFDYADWEELIVKMTRDA